MSPDSGIFENTEHSKSYLANIYITNLESSRLHWHYDYELIIVLNGSLLVYAGSEPSILQPGGYHADQQ